MSATIEFSNGSSWFKANWVFRQLAADMARSTTDPEILHALEMAEAFHMLDLRETSDLSCRLIDLLRATAKKTLDGEIANPLPDYPTGRELYCGTLAELLGTIDKITSAQ